MKLKYNNFMAAGYAGLSFLAVLAAFKLNNPVYIAIALISYQVFITLIRFKQA